MNTSKNEIVEKQKTLVKGIGQPVDLPVTNVSRIRPKLFVKTNETELLEVKFEDCILKLLNFNEDEGNVHCNYEDNILVLSPANCRQSADKNCATLKHPHVCPLMELSNDNSITLSESITSRGVAIGVAVMLVSSDNHVLLSRRPLHMRTFPGIWVPPGGHVEAEETLEEAVLRELHEETGLHVCPGEDALSMLAMWESAYPPVLSWGVPVRHHLVIYYYCSVSKSHSELTQILKLDPDEVSVCTWLSPNQVESLLNDTSSDLPEDQRVLHAVIVSKAEPQYVAVKDVTELFTCSGLRPGRISMGTQFALGEWLKKINSYDPRNDNRTMSSPSRSHL